MADIHHHHFAAPPSTKLPMDHEPIRPGVPLVKLKILWHNAGSRFVAPRSVAPGADNLLHRPEDLSTPTFFTCYENEVDAFKALVLPDWSAVERARATYERRIREWIWTKAGRDLYASAKEIPADRKEWPASFKKLEDSQGDLNVDALYHEANGGSGILPWLSVEIVEELPGLIADEEIALDRQAESLRRAGVGGGGDAMAAALAAIAQNGAATVALLERLAGGGDDGELAKLRAENAKLRAAAKAKDT